MNLKLCPQNWRIYWKNHVYNKGSASTMHKERLRVTDRVAAHIYIHSLGG